MASPAEPGRALALVMKAVERRSGGADIGFVLTLRAPIDGERLYRAYCRLVERHPAVRMRFAYDRARRRYRWAPLPERAWRAILADERASVCEPHDLEALASAWRPLDERLPLLVYGLDARRCYVAVQHAWADGLGAIGWIRRLLRLYGGEDTAAIEQRHPDAASASHGSAPGADPAPRAWREMLWFLWFAVLRLPRSHTRAGSVVDLSHGARPGVGNDRGYGLLRYRLARPDLLAVYRRAWQGRLSLTQYFCGVLSEVLLEAAPTKARVRLSVPVAIERPARPAPGAAGPGARVDAWPGLATASLPFEIEAGRDWREQIVREFRWLDRGVPAAYDRCLELAVRLLGDRRALRFFAAHLGLPHADPRRGYLRQFTCIVSSLGVVDAPEIVEHLESLSVHGKSEILSMGLLVTSGGLTLDVIPPRHVYAADEIERLMDRVMQRLVE
jgi:hypothetical protein